jgi:hypothetical protein
MKDKNLVFAITVAIVAAVLWIASSVISTQMQVEINPSAEAFSTSIGSVFNDDVLGKVSSRTDTTIPIKPEVFRSYENLGN